MNTLPLTLLAAATLGIASPSPAASGDKNSFHAHIVLYVQDGEEIPGGYAPRLQSLGLRTEAFLTKWMSHWKTPIDRSKIFARDKDGKINITLVRGNVFNPGGRGALPGIRKHAIQSAKNQISLDPENPATWWIFYHSPGVKGFQGGGGPTGGIAINAYPDAEGTIDIAAGLGNSLMGPVNRAFWSRSSPDS